VTALSHPRYASLQTAAPRRAGLVVALALHALAIAGLLRFEPARTALIAAAPIMVDLLAPPAPEPRIEKPTELPKPKPITKAPPKAAEPQPILTAPSEAPSTAIAPPQPPAAPAPVPADAAPAAPAAPKPALPLTQPIFNADYLDNPAPAYPSLSRRSGEQGRVMLRVLVSPAGRADEAQVRTSSGSARLDEAARTTVLRWKFVPAKRGDEAVAAWVLIPITFRLEG
jgi:periplasmic protein TonB